MERAIETLKRSFHLTDIVISINDLCFAWNQDQNLLTPLYENGHNNQPFEVNNERE